MPRPDIEPTDELIVVQVEFTEGTEKGSTTKKYVLTKPVSEAQHERAPWKYEQVGNLTIEDIYNH